MDLRASVVVIGDELLGGYVRDRNSWVLAQRLRDAAVPLDRVVTVPDDRAAIIEALALELGRPRPRLLLTSGGVGPTPDDVTVEAVAEVLGVPLVTHPEAVTSVEGALAWTLAQGMAVPEEQLRRMRRLADLPEGAWLLAGGPGRTPGVAVDVDGGCRAPGGATVVVLPGVPAELERIVDQGVVPALLAGRGDPAHVVEVTHGYPESFLAPLLARLADDVPGLGVGSYPGASCVVRLRGPRPAVEAAAAAVRAHLAVLDADPAAGAVRARWRDRWAVPPG